MWREVHTCTCRRDGQDHGNQVKEHKHVVSRGDTNNGIAVHANCHDHQILWVVEREPFWLKRKIKEALYTKRTSPNMNLDGGYQYTTRYEFSNHLTSTSYISYFLYYRFLFPFKAHL